VDLHVSAWRARTANLDAANPDDTQQFAADAGLLPNSTPSEILYMGSSLGNNRPFYLVPAKVAAVLVCGHYRPYIAGRLLHRNDISDGLYIYHMPVANVFYTAERCRDWAQSQHP
jgi:hypothetical protein